MINRVAQRLCVLLFVFACTTIHADTLRIPLSGMGEVPSSGELVVNPALLENGEIELGNQKVQNFSISHTGGPEALSIEVLSVEIGGQDSFDFVSDYVGYNILETGQTIDFTVTFAPVTLGYKKAFLRINHSGENSPHLVLLTGIGIDVPSSELQISETEIDFGNTEAGTNSTQSITLTNAGGESYPPINIFSATITGDTTSSFTNDFANTVTLAPGESTQIFANLNSSIAGKKEAVLAIEHDGSNPTIRVGFEGTVTLPPEPVVNTPDNAPDNDNPAPVITGPQITPEFNNTVLTNAKPDNPTSLQFGPDGNLYVSERDGYLYQYEVSRTNTNTYTVTNTDKIDLIQKMPNRNDDGELNDSIKGRLVTGILVTGTANNPEIYVASGDPRQGAGPSGNDTNLDTNSVIISRLTKSGNNWIKTDLIRGLPRSEENHQGNGMQLSADGNTLFISMGGHTNMGVPSNNFARLPEYALSSAILEIDLTEIGNSTYDLPTLDDEDRPGTNDSNDPFGGNNGKNMAILDPSGPIEIYSPGWRNAYDLLLNSQGRMYTVDNGPNNGWGNIPGGNCLGTFTNGGKTFGDGLHFIAKKGYYGGHPNPTRGSKSNTFNESNPQSPIIGDVNTDECVFKTPGKEDGALHVFGSSTNGLTEYTASNFGGAMQGDILTASFNQSIYRIQLNNAGSNIIGLDKFFTNLGTPLDVTAQGDNDVFPGTVWVADFGSDSIRIYEPKDYQ